MKIPKEFEDVFHGVELTEDEIRTLTWIAGWESRTVENLRSAIQKVRAPRPHHAPGMVKQTNADRIRAMSDEEMAEWLCEGLDCGYCKKIRGLLGGRICDNQGKGVLDWLQSPAKGDT